MRKIVPWLALVIIIVGCSLLGNWQLNRADFKRALQSERDNANASAALPIGGTANDRIKPTQANGRRILARGQWLADKTVLLDNRTYQGVPGFYVISPLQLANSSTVILVLRGWIAANLRNRTIPPAISHQRGVIEIEGIGESELAQSMQLATEAEPKSKQIIWQYFDFEKYDRWSGLSAQKFIVRQTSDSSDQLVRDWPVAGDGVDRHLGYAFQWFAMAGAALIFLVWRILTRRRKPATGT